MKKCGPPYNIFSTKHNIFCLFVNILMRFIFQLFFFSLSAKCRKQFNIFEKQNCKRVCVNDLMKVFITIIYHIFFLFCLSKCKIHVVAKFIVLKMPVST
jgi:hypothetical protein